MPFQRSDFPVLGLDLGLDLGLVGGVVVFVSRCRRCCCCSFPTSYVVCAWRPSPSSCVLISRPAGYACNSAGDGVAQGVPGLHALGQDAKRAVGARRSGEKSTYYIRFNSPLDFCVTTLLHAHCTTVMCGPTWEAVVSYLEANA